MSHTKGAVLFINERSIYYFEYDGTSCQVLNKLYKSEREVEDNWRSFRSGVCRCPKPLARTVDVEIMTLYGDGFYWKGRACQRCRHITFGTNPYGYGIITQEGIPDWSPWHQSKATTQKAVAREHRDEGVKQS